MLNFVHMHVRLPDLHPSIHPSIYPSVHLSMSWGHVEAGDHHEVGFAEVDSGLQFVGHSLQSL